MGWGEEGRGGGISDHVTDNGRHLDLSLGAAEVEDCLGEEIYGNGGKI